MENALIHPITDAHLAQMSNLHSGSVQFGPLTISWTIDLSQPEITADLTLYGVSFGHVVLDTTNPTATIGHSVGIASADVTLTADFANKKIDYEVLVKVFGATIVDKKGTMFGW